MVSPVISLTLSSQALGLNTFWVHRAVLARSTAPAPGRHLKISIELLLLEQILSPLI